MTIDLAPGLASRCVQLEARGDGGDTVRTSAMATTGKSSLVVAVFQGGLSAQVTLQAIGYFDEGCTAPTSPAERSDPAGATFLAGEVVAAALTVKAAAGVDADGDGWALPEDCDDQNAAINPGTAELCSDGIDNDCDNSIDCLDPACAAQACGSGASCRSDVCAEDLCDDGLDNDGDTAKDCADTDCAGKPCLNSGVCTAGTCYAANETGLCADLVDNDGDQLIDCADSDCSTAPCNDGNLCTSGETCLGTSCAGGAPQVCNTPPNACFAAAGSCALGVCSYAFTPDAGCSDGVACTENDSCLDDGGCAGVTKVCASPPNAECYAPTGTCIESSGGSCDYPALEDNPCDDGLACTTGEKCTATGACASTTFVNCPSAGQCFDPGVCTEPSGSCAYTARTGSCDDGDNCTTSDGCLADGGCAGAPTSCAGTGTICQPWQGTCAANGACDYSFADAGVPCPSGSCNGAGACVPDALSFPYVPSNFALTDVPSLDGGLVVTVSCSTTLSTTGAADGGPAITSGSCVQLPPWRVISQAGGPAAVLFAMDGLVVNSSQTLTLTGYRPAIFAVVGDATLDGTILTRAGAGNSPSCLSGGAGLPGTSSGTEGGGGGGGFGTAGADGGAGTGSGGRGLGGAANGTAALVPLRGGCNGGQGGGGTSAGAGGGAVQLSVRGTLNLQGVVTAPGRRGIGASSTAKGGGGGGAGGAVLLEADAIVVSSSSVLTANGGGGGEGSSGLGGDDGEDGRQNSETVALGGSGGSSCGGEGGNGATRTSASTAGTNGTNGCGGNNGGGGAGGGGVGRIRLNASQSCTLPGSGNVISPTATSNGTSGCP